MTLERLGKNSIIATLTADDMTSCCIDYSTMSLSDSATHALLCDLLALMEDMGLRRTGDRVTVECSACPDGGCRMFFTVQSAEQCRFESADDVIAAADAGAMPLLPYTLVPDGNGIILIPLVGLSPCEKLLLSEFCCYTAS